MMKQGSFEPSEKEMTNTEDVDADVEKRTIMSREDNNGDDDGETNGEVAGDFEASVPDEVALLSVEDLKQSENEKEGEGSALGAVEPLPSGNSDGRVQASEDDVASMESQLADAAESSESSSTKELKEQTDEGSLDGSSVAGCSVSVEAIESRSSNATDPPLILWLPIDSLHCIASFLSPCEWANFGLSGKPANRVCREIFRRVRMHGFRCATEVVTAWKLGQHGDARELSALYIEAGVPIYPYSLGHSYHTLNWRMGIEARELQRPEAEAEPDGNDAIGTHESNDLASVDTRRQHVDRFYTERLEARTRENYSESLTYLEEKSLFWLDARVEDDDAAVFNNVAHRGASLTPHRLLARPPPIFQPGLDAGGGEAGFARPPGPPVRLQSMGLSSRGFSSNNSNMAPLRGLHRSNSHSELRVHTPKVLIKIHRHLLDQHLLGKPNVNDGDGAMITPPVSLSADFFHPHFSTRTLHPRQQQLSASAVAERFTSSGAFASWDQQVPESDVGMDLAAFEGGFAPESADNVNSQGQGYNMGGIVEGMMGADDSDSDAEEAARHPEAIANNQPAFEQAHDTAVPAPVPLLQEATVHASPAGVNQHFVLSNIDLDVYSASSVSAKADGDKADGKETKNHLQARFASYHRRLEMLLAHDDSADFEECLLDFWDEFLPQTANIHYYDRHTAVPRITCLHKFLTKPCPKAIGIVQCEIERIKLNSKKKGVNVKGRFFPTYEYRLFIRDRTHESENSDSTERPRRDTILMMAKNRGRKHVEVSGSASVSSISKKGANNYYLYMPQQSDVDDHFNHVNNRLEPAKVVPNGAGHCPTYREASVLLGRLQSNFIGTEFQIFSPHIRKQRNARSYVRSSTGPLTSSSISSVPSNAIASDDDIDYDSGLSSENLTTSSRRRSRFSRLSLRRGNCNSHGEQSTITEMESLENDNPAIPEIRRTRSSSDIPAAYNRPSRSRRAIANTTDVPESHRVQTTIFEEEDGAITYTANLLGSRPRIMDVCIPKVTPDGCAGAEWKRYLDMFNDGDGAASNRMLNRFKQLQQRMENEEQGAGTTNEQGVLAVEGSDEYTPPDDFGLLALQNRPPWWNIELGSFVLNFGGRVSVASVKNFQLCDRNDQDYIMLQFGRIQGRHSFTMDFQYPLTAMQAFAIAISSLQSKISFG